MCGVETNERSSFHMQERISGNAYRTTMIYIDSYQDGNPVGRYYNPYLDNIQSFTGLMDLLLKIDGMLDEMHFPQSFNAVRSFSKVSKINGRGTDSEAASGKVATFAVRIMFRQNASWQGSISWLEGKSEESFRSVLELLFLMDSACRAE